MRPSLAEALVQGGDARLELLPPQGANRYGCTPLPRDAVCSFSSCTASTISTPALAAVEQEFALLHHADDHADALALALARRAEHQRAELLELLGQTGTGTRLVFAPSGTDAIALAVLLARAGTTHPCDSVLIAPDESGRGVPVAAAGCLGDGWSSQPGLPPAGAPIPGLADHLRLVAVPARTGDGAARAPHAIDDQVRDAVRDAVAAGRQALVHAMDSSKCGLRSPSPGVLDDLQSRHGPAVTIMVDACQGRISADRLRWHLERGHLVTITGSKFHGGPPFSGALLVPPAFQAMAAGMRAMPAILARLTAASAWPAEWPLLRAATHGPPNLGLHLRWTAAVADMRAYDAISHARRHVLLRTISTMMQSALDRQPSIAAVVPAADPGGDDGREDALPTIFPFLLHHDGRPLSYDASWQIYQQLHALGMHLGQPVRLGGAGALRICADARLVRALAEAPDGPAAGVDLSRKLDQVLATCVRLAGQGERT